MKMGKRGNVLEAAMWMEPTGHQGPEPGAQVRGVGWRCRYQHGGENLSSERCSAGEIPR